MKNKPYNIRKPRNYMERPVARLSERDRFLIVCEGKKTEPNYFSDFPVPKKIVRIVGCGFNTIRLVEEAITLKTSSNFEQVWCVFDHDDFPLENIAYAIQLAKNNNIQVAFSNESFELWYILHFEYLTSAISRHAYCDKLGDRDHFGFNYEKNAEHLYRTLLHRQDFALRNARRLIQEYEVFDPATCNPSTTIHLLVEQLNNQIGNYID